MSEGRNLETEADLERILESKMSLYSGEEDVKHISLY
jgi:hypothetical protein